MPTIYKPSSWKSPAKEALQGFDDLYTVELLNEIVGDGPQFLTNTDRIVFKGRIRFIALELYAAQKMKGRPSGPEKRAAFQRLQDHTARVLADLRLMDVDSKAAIFSAAGLDGDIRVAEATRNLVRLRWWTRKAERSLGPTPRGRPADLRLRDAIKALETAWNKAAGRSPKWTPFVQFVSRSLSPIVGDIDFDGPCREVLYGEKSGKRRPD